MTSELRDPSIAVGDVVGGRYRILRTIARGGMGYVHEAVHEVLRMPVALKTLSVEGLDPVALRERLMREAGALGRLRHPGIVRALDAGDCPLHGPYLVLERVVGGTLDGVLHSRRTLEADDLAHVGDQLGHALCHAHDRGVIHRDVKPSNVMVERQGGHDRLRLIDFGIALTSHEDPFEAPKLTRPGMLVGTAEYVAPELILDGAKASVASDVYALGALLFECATGDVPRIGDLGTIARAWISGPPIPSIRALRPDLPAALDRAILRALARHPSERWARADELAAACRAAVPVSRDDVWSLHDGEHDEAAEREHARAPYVSPVRVITRAGAFDGRSEDVSEGGLLVVVDAALSDGERVTVRFPLPISGRVVSLEATARWARTRNGQKAVGLAFVDLPPAPRSDVHRYVAGMGLSSATGTARSGSAPRAA